MNWSEILMNLLEISLGEPKSAERKFCWNASKIRCTERSLNWSRLNWTALSWTDVKWTDLKWIVLNFRWTALYWAELVLALRTLVTVCILFLWSSYAFSPRQFFRANKRTVRQVPRWKIYQAANVITQQRKKSFLINLFRCCQTMHQTSLVKL